MENMYPFNRIFYFITPCDNIHSCLDLYYAFMINENSDADKRIKISMVISEERPFHYILP